MSPVQLLVVVALLAAAALASSSSGGAPNFNYELSGAALTDLYNQPVFRAERVRRPIPGLPFTHTGVRVTLQDGEQWLVHKGDEYGRSSQTVVTSADNMSSKWKVEESREFEGTRTVADFVAAGGAEYRLFRDNCHHGSRRMMDQ